MAGEQDSKEVAGRKPMARDPREAASSASEERPTENSSSSKNESEEFTSSSKKHNTSTEAGSSLSNISSDSPILLDQAQRFLEDNSIRDAPHDQKLAFLKSKGLDEDALEQIRQSFAQEKSNGEQTASGVAPSAGDSSSPPQAPQPPPHSSDFSERGTTTKAHTPPIITYPEYLRPKSASSATPPPLITTNRLLTTLYATTGLWSALYGLSHYLVNPILSSLTEQRHDFALHAQYRIDELNDRLSSIVLEDPASKHLNKNKHHRVGGEDEDAVSNSDSDPTELFHRDIGVQTSPSLTPRRGTDASSPSSPLVPEPDAVLVGNIDALDRIKSVADDLYDESKEEGATADAVSQQTRLLYGLFDKLASSDVSPKIIWEQWGDDPGGFRREKLKSGTGGDDEVSKMKAEIRGVKGVLLSARNFPGAGCGGAGANGGGGGEGLWGGNGGSTGVPSYKGAGKSSYETSREALFPPAPPNGVEAS